MRSQPPAPRRSDAYADDGRRQGPSRRDTPVRGTGRTALLPDLPGWTPLTAAVLGPIVAAIIGQAAGNYYGPGFAVLSVAAALLAAAATAPRWMWFLIPGMPAVIWLVAAVAELEWHNPPYEGSKAEAVGLVHATTHGFPVMAASIAVMGLVAVVGVVRERKQERNQEPSRGARRG